MAHRGPYIVKILGKRTTADRQIDCLAKVILAFNDTEDQYISKLSRLCCQKRRLIANKKEYLRININDRPDLVEKYSERFGNNWWIYTNFNGKSVISWIHRCCIAADKIYGVDVEIEYEKWGVEKPAMPMTDEELMHLFDTI